MSSNVSATSTATTWQPPEHSRSAQQYRSPAWLCAPSQLSLAIGLVCGFSMILGAFLAFQVQPLISKAILPWFGGGPLVWNACLVFFQCVLLGGYLYAHCLQRIPSITRQASIHTAVLLLSLLSLPILPDSDWMPSDGTQPAARVLLILAAHVGVPYMLLAATSPLFQVWYAAVRSQRPPYRLFALSNAGSLVALLSFPFLFEPLLPARGLAMLWASGYVLFVVCSVLTAWGAARYARITGCDEATGSMAKGATETTVAGCSERQVPQPVLQCLRSLRQLAAWFSLAALGTITLMSISDYICQEVSVSPVLWVIPLSLYLTTYIIAFERPNAVPLPLGAGLALLAVLTFAVFLSDYWYQLDATWQAWGGPGTPTEWLVGLQAELIIPIFALTAICFLAHGLLARLRPQQTDQLTRFYLALAAGGAAGGMIVSIVCPRLFTGFPELTMVLVAGWLLAVWLLFGVPWQTHSSVVLRAVRIGLTLGGVALIAHLRADDGGDIVLARFRNSYGGLQLELATGHEELYGTAMYHGRTLHGFQYTEQAESNTPTTYYSHDSGIGVLLQVQQELEPQLNIGVVGLGVGTLAAYGRPSDRLDFYEINPLVIRLAQEEFTFLKNTAARSTVHCGDARVSLSHQLAEQPANQSAKQQHGATGRQFDLLVLDAFSGDAIPVHLLTREAFDLYRQHLRPDGAIAVHISNRYFSLEPVMAAAAKQLGWQLRIIETMYDEETTADAGSDWALLTARQDILTAEPILQRVSEVRPYKRVRWTDQFASLFTVARDASQ